MLSFSRIFFKMNQRNLFNISRVLMCLLVLFAVELCFAVCSPTAGRAQTPNVTLQTSNQPLSQLLNGLSVSHKIRFAFDSDRFSTIKVSVNVKNMPLDSFMDLLAKKYGIGSKKIGNSYALFYDEKLIQKESASKPTAKPKPVITVANMKGYFRDRFSNQRLRNASICFDSDSILEPNKMGFFKNRMLTKKQLKISADQLSYQNLDTTISFSSDMIVDLIANPQSLVDGDQNVNEKYFELLKFEEATGFTELSKNSPTFAAALSNHDLIFSLLWIPGFSAFDRLDESSDFYDTHYTVDGALSYASPYLYGNMGLVNGKMAHQIFASHGGMDASFDGQNGWVEVIGKTGGTPELDLTLTPIFANIYAGLPLGKKVSASLAVRRSYMDGWNDYWTNNLANETLLDVNGLVSKEGSFASDLFFQDAHAKISYSPNANHQIFVSYTGSANDQASEFAQNSEILNSNFSEERNHAFAAEWDAQLSNKWTSSLVAGSTLLKGDQNNQYATAGSLQIGEEQMDTKLWNHRIDWKSEFVSKLWQHRFGAGLNYYDLDQNFGLNVQETSLSEYMPFDNQLTIAHLFTQHRVSLFNDKLSLNAGLRARYDITGQSFGILPRYSVEYSMGDGAALYYKGGRYEQFLNKINRFDLQGNRSLMWLLSGDDWGKAQYSWNNIAGFRYKVNSLTINAEFGYNRKLNQQICWGTSQSENGNQKNSYTLYSGDNTDLSVDFFAQYLQRKFSHQVRYSFGNKSNQFDEINGGEAFASADDRAHKLQLTERFFVKGWVATANWTFATGLPFYNSSQSLDVVAVQRSTNFSQFDLQVAKHYKTEKASYECGVSLLNVFNRENQLSIRQYGYVLPTSEQVVMKSVRTSIAFTPMVYLSVKF